MNWLFRFWQSTVGKKFVMGISGLVGFGFAFGHMAGNMLVYAGPEALNAYGTAIKANKILLWGTRGVLIAALVIHVVAALSLQAIKSAARPVPYSKPGNIQAKPGSRSMMLLGMILLAFLVYHILHLTVGTVAPSPFVVEDVYGNVVRGFSNPLIAGWYVFAMAALALHLSHGGYSMFYSLGMIHPKYQVALRNGSYLLCIAIVLGNLSIPISVYLGIVKPAGH